MKRSVGLLIGIVVCTLRIANAADDVPVIEGKPVAWKLADGSTVRFFWLQHSPSAWRETVKYFEYLPASGDLGTQLVSAIAGSPPSASTTMPSVKFPPDGVTFRFAISHSGYQRVELRASEDEQLLWIVDASDRSPRRVGCSFDRRAGTFVGEGGTHPSVVGAHAGKVLRALTSE